MSTSSDRPWRDPALSAARRADLLLQAMTLEEKIAQLGSRWAGNDMADTELPADETINVAPMEDVFATGASLSLAEASRDGLGHLTRVWGSVPLSVAVPLMAGRPVFAGGVLGAIRPSSSTSYGASSFV